ncbi:MAG: M20/M25/M40 family metallo-hydrolase [Oscillospiraceae bacterium]|nr:M20/M25/M40 family metallo-hydrolase [Oscillospiraceae bacterium]
MGALYALLGLFVLWLAVILIRAAAFKPKKGPSEAGRPIEFDRDGVVNSLAELVKCKTVSNMDPALEDDAEFSKLISLLPGLYPRVFDVCSVNQLPGRALLLRWPGKSDEHPSVMMSHYDVVPVDEEKWEKPPFAGIIEDGVLWGRGTLDTKATLNGVLSAANHLIGTGFVPENDIYFAFSGGEEVNGPGASNIVKYFADHHIQPALVVDEGGAVVENVFPGVHIPCGLIGIAEKGMINAQYKVESAGGHASAPPVKTPITVLAQAVRRLSKKPFKMHITKPAAEMFDTLGRHSSFLYKIIFANMWCFSWVIDLLGRMSGGEMNALVRTTVAFTQMQGSSARNVIPTEAAIVTNMRLNPADSVGSALAYLKKVVDDPNVEITALESHEPSPISETGCDAWNKVAASVEQTWPGCIVAPYLMVQCSDSRHYRDLSNHVYRFSAMDMTKEERASVHGNNERIRLEAICRAVEFYIRLMMQC